MISIKRLSFVLFIVLALYMNAPAQTPRVNTISITAEADKVHVAAQGDVTELRLEVLDDAGDVVFESGAISGNQLDWNMKDAQGERVAAGTYLATVTFRTASGKLRKRVEQISVEEIEKANAQNAPAPAPNAPQATVMTSGTTTAGHIPKFSSASTITNSVMIENNSNMGIGVTPRAGWRLDVLGRTLMRTGGSGGGEIQFGTPNSETGLAITGAASGSNRADLRFNGQTVRLVAGVGTGIPPATNGIVVSTAGNVGIGTEPTTTAKLTLRGGISANATTASAAVRGTAVTNAAGLYGVSFRGAGVYGESNAATIEGVGVAGKNTAGGWAMYAAGNTGQNRANSGWVKAMVYINTDHTVVRCFNSQLPDGGASLPPNGRSGCGFTVNANQNAISHYINFGFRVSDRFVAISPQQSGTALTGANFVFTSDPNLIRVDTFTTDNATELAPASVMVVVY